MRRYRQIAQNIDDRRVEIYIEEAEELDILPAIGADLYRRFRNLGAIYVNSRDALESEEGVEVLVAREADLPSDELRLLNGGYYNDGCATKYFAGIKKALAYFAYARFVRDHSTQVTPFGVVVKAGDDSNPASDRSVASKADDATRIGEAYLNETMEYWRTINNSCCDGRQSKRQHRFSAIG